MEHPEFLAVQGTTKYMRRYEFEIRFLQMLRVYGPDVNFESTVFPSRG